MLETKPADMDRESLVQRNQLLVEAFHRKPAQHRLRHWLLRSLCYLPIEPLSTDANRLLLIRPDHVGDVLLMTPAIHALKTAHPFVEVHVLAGPWAASLLANVPDVDLVLTLDFPGFNRNAEKPNALAPYQQLLKTSRQLRQIGYHTAVILRPDHWWGAVLAYLAGIRTRIGFALPDVTPFLTDAIPFQPEHAVLQNARLLQSWISEPPREELRFQFNVYADDRQHVATLLAQRGIHPRQEVIALHPGSGQWVKLWSSEKWAQVADALIERTGASLVLTGSEPESALVNSVLEQMQGPAHALVGETNLGQLAALYKRASLVLGPDSGPLHIAAAVGTPTVALFGPADPIEFAPWGDPAQHRVLTSDIACRPCRVLDWGDDAPEFHPCVREITVGKVLNAAYLALSAASSR